MKKAFLILLCIPLLFTFVACGKKPYSFLHPLDEIDRVEIVEAENIDTFTVKKTLSETEKTEFLEQFKKIKFSQYIIGDPMSVHGNAFKITYKNGDYEIICHFWNDYVKNGDQGRGWRNCDEREFNALLDQFSD